jgi:hypothetical protein
VDLVKIKKIFPTEKNLNIIADVRIKMNNENKNKNSKKKKISFFAEFPNNSKAINYKSDLNDYESKGNIIYLLFIQ